MAQVRNVTITLKPEVARWARIKAAELDTSVSRYVGDLLKERMQEDEYYQKAMEQYINRPTVILHEPNKSLPSRDELYDRDLLR